MLSRESPAEPWFSRLLRDYEMSLESFPEMVTWLKQTKQGLDTVTRLCDSLPVPQLSFAFSGIGSEAHVGFVDTRWLPAASWAADFEARLPGCSPEKLPGTSQCSYRRAVSRQAWPPGITLRSEEREGGSLRSSQTDWEMEGSQMQVGVISQRGGEELSTTAVQPV